MPLLFNGNHRSSSSEIPVWDLKSSSSEVPDEVQHFRYVNGSASQLEQDNRTSVNRRDILPGGKYRGIAKLFLRFENSDQDTWVIATGFLVRDDLVVTAGHSVYDWEYNLGELIEAKVYLGYTGKQNIDNAEVEFRSGKRVATTPEWMEKGGRREANVAFIKLSKPFRDVTPFDYRDTPESDKMNIGVVGYAGDLKKNGEPGAQLYECFQDEKWDLGRSKWQMLEYQIDAYGGNVGAPVFDEDMNCIGVHTYGGDQNCATVIGRRGHSFEPYFDALDSRSERQRGGRQPQNRGRGDIDNEDQDLVSQILRLVRDVPEPIPRNILSPGTSLSLGQLGIPAGAVANIALSAAANAVTEDVDTFDNNFDRDQAFDSITQRAILAEAALAAVQEMSPRLRQNEHVFNTITQVVTDLLPTIQQAGSTVINSTQEPLLRLALDEVKKGGQRSGRSASIPSIRLSRGSRRGVSGRKGQFVDALCDGARDERTERFINNIASEGLSDDAEVKWDSLNISKRLSSTSSIIEAGKKQPEMIGPLLVSKSQQQQQYQQHGRGMHHQYQQQITLHNLHQLIDMDMQDDEFPLSIECLPLRAVVAEAALQAILRIQQQDLEEEGLFDTMRDVIRKHGPTVMKIAPAVIRKVAPVFTAIANEGGDYGRGEYVRGGEYAKYGTKYGSRREGSPQRYRLTTKAKGLAKNKLASAGMGISSAEKMFLQAF
ncbi:trypsin-like serine peptidase [Aspergillus mulundensis]|uniref:Serine protease n=1 Tax=Aspergillus mulundensis TaxID=1810919 RepID=A0A3D8SLF3_9EURO|nr:Serine protease [Aspergillus mulundensis]RDW87140.1 Serine protease [Aspergillus mulundensis]